MQGAEDERDRKASGGGVLWRHVMGAQSRRAATLTGAAPPADSPPRSPPPSRTPERAISSAIGRAAEKVCGLPLFFDRVELGHAQLAELAEIFPDQALISVIEGPGDGLGVMAICPGLLASLIEMQTAGRISARRAGPRRPTRTDGAICAEFINGTVAELAGELASLPGRPCLRGYRYASFLEDPRPLDLMLDEGTHHLISVRLRAGDSGQRDGQLILAWPVPEPVEEAAAVPAEIGEMGLGPATGQDLAEAVHSVPIELSGYLCRRRITLRDLNGLAPGTTITLPPDALGAATLETATGQTLFHGKLGEVAGHYALRLLPRQAAAPIVAAKGVTPVPADSDAAGPVATPPESGPGGPPAKAFVEPPICDLDAPDPFRHPAAAVASPSFRPHILADVIDTDAAGHPAQG